MYHLPRCSGPCDGLINRLGSSGCHVCCPTLVVPTRCKPMQPDLRSRFVAGWHDALVLSSGMYLLLDILILLHCFCFTQSYNSLSSLSRASDYTVTPAAKGTATISFCFSDLLFLSVLFSPQACVSPKS